jgi:hypothetical protein
MLTAPAPLIWPDTRLTISQMPAHSVNFMVVSRASYSICVERKLEEDTADEIRRQAAQSITSAEVGVHA